MANLISLEQHIHRIYDESAKRIIQYTPQLFIYKENSVAVKSHGSSILIKARNTHYMATARHCVTQNNEQIKIGVLDKHGHLRLISGHAISRSGENDRIDLSLIKLVPDSVAILSEKYAFLPFNRLAQTLNIADERDYLLVGHPVSKTSIDNARRKIRFDPLIYIAKSKPRASYARLGYDMNVNTLLHYDRRRGMFLGKSEKIMNPNPTGISGSGLWYIESYEVANPDEALFSLMGIMIEYHDRHRMVVATKTEELVRLFQKSIDQFGNN